MKKITFLFGIHCHQPVGNFDHVFRKSFDDCYLPLIKTLARHPEIRFAFHISGPLIEWLEKNEKNYIDSLGEMVSKKQIEIMGGGFYEPILVVIPRKDALGQIKMMSDYIEKRFGQRPRGIWLTERIWEPQIASLLNESGIEYTNIDDAHFSYSGLQAKDMFGYYVTEDNGATLKVFPTDKTLRYTVPFKLPEVTIQYLKSIADESGKSATLADDGEKFGVWPGTHKWVYTDGYLENFCRALENNRDWIEIKTFSEYIDTAPPMGRIYLPTASYEEMMEWALPVSSIKGYEHFIQYLKQNNAYEQNKPYVRGGFWRNFMAKYVESNLMNKKMLFVSAKANSRKNPDKETLQEVWRAQCNCAYWHGLFGGLYLNYLRHAVYHHLINAENLLDKKSLPVSLPRLQYIDYDADGNKEIIYETKKINCYISPYYGGSIMELDARDSCFNLSNCLARREEAYHAKIREAEKNLSKNSDSQPKSAHDIVRVKESGLDRFLSYDRNNRFSFIDHFVPVNTTLEDFILSRYEEIGDFAGKPFKVIQQNKDRKNSFVLLKRNGNISQNGTFIPVVLQKKYVFKGNEEIYVDYSLKSDSGKLLKVKFVTELNFTLLAGDADDRYYHINGRKLGNNKLSSIGEENNLTSVQMIDEWANICLSIGSKSECSVWRYPVETVSQSEDGFERNYQNSCLLLVNEFELTSEKPVNMQFSITIRPAKL